MERVDRVAVKKMLYSDVQPHLDPLFSPGNPGQTLALAPAEAPVFVVAVSGDFQPHVKYGVPPPAGGLAWQMTVFEGSSGRPVLDLGEPDGQTWPGFFDALPDVL